MYNAVPRAAQAWRALFDKVFAECALEIDWIEHRGPRPIAELWAMPDLCCDFMCGWPFAKAGNSATPSVPFHTIVCAPSND